MHSRASFGRRSLGSLVGVVALALPLVVPANAAGLRPYEVLLYGTVRAIDAPARSMTIAYAPLDTAAGGTREVRVLDPQVLMGLRRGDPIRAIADTRRTPWTVRDVRRMP